MRAYRLIQPRRQNLHQNQETIEMANLSDRLNNSNLSDPNAETTESVAETTESVAENIVDNNSQHQDNTPSCLFCNKQLKKRVLGWLYIKTLAL